MFLSRFHFGGTCTSTAYSQGDISRKEIGKIIKLWWTRKYYCYCWNPTSYYCRYWFILQKNAVSRWELILLYLPCQKLQKRGYLIPENNFMQPVIQTTLASLAERKLNNESNYFFWTKQFSFFCSQQTVVKDRDYNAMRLQRQKLPDHN